MRKEYSRYNKEWTEDEIHYFLKNYPTTSKDEMTKYLNRSWEAIKHRGRKYGIRRDTSFIRKHINVDLNFFSIPTNVNSYFAGLLATDGCIQSKNRNEVSISLKKEDIHILKEFSLFCKYSGKIRDRKDGMCRLRICGVPQWIEDLRNNFNIIPCKTFVLCPPENLSNECELSYIKGFIDGDGGIYDYSKGFCINITGMYKPLLWIKERFDIISPSKRSSNVLPKENVFQYSINGKRARVIYKTLKNIQTPEFERKWKY